MAKSQNKKKKKRGHYPAHGYTRSDYPDAFEDILCARLGDDWFSFGLQIGFDHDQLVQLQELYPSDKNQCSKCMLQKWKSVVVKHTLKCVPLLYFGLIQIKHNDLAKDLLGATDSDKPDAESRDILSDLLKDLKKLSFNMEEDKDDKDQVHGKIFIITNCANVAIGHRCQISVKEAKKELENPQSEKLKREAIMIGMLQSILDPTDVGNSKEMSLQKLETAFTRLYGTRRHEKKSFYEMSGTKLKDFLANHSDIFSMKKSRGNKGASHFVKCNIVNRGHSPEYCLSSKKIVSKDDDQTQVQPKSLSDSCSSDRSISDSVFAENETENGWIKVEHRSRKSQKNNNLENDEQFPPLCPIRWRPRYEGRQKSYAAVTASCVSEGHSQRESNCEFVPEHCCSYSFPENQLISRSKSDDAIGFLKYLKYFKKGHFILFTPKLDKEPYLEALALVPWISVFDFDYYSRDVGLLSMIEDKIKLRRSLYVCSWKDSPQLSHHGTQWCLIKGSVQEADSNTPENDQKWMFLVREGYEKYLVDLANFSDNYTTLKVVVIWPSDIETSRCMFRAVSKLQEFLDDPNIVLIDPGGNHSHDELSLMNLIKPDFTVVQPFGEIFRSISDNLGERYSVRNFTYRLPTSDGTNTPDIDEPLSAVLREDLEILYKDSPYRSSMDSESMSEELDNEACHFYRGGNLRWFAFYEAGAGHFDAERDLTFEIVTKITKCYIEQFRSGKITIYHAPGAGGTTLGQRIIWELRNVTPCGQIRMNSTSSTQALLDRIETLFEKTNLPIVLLIDGEDQQRITHLYKLVDRARIIVILVHVRRCNRQLDSLILKENEFCLPEAVSRIEARKVGLKFSSQCDTPAKKDQIDGLVNEVSNGIAHLMYEFGMVAFLEEFKGVRSFVRGYLQLDNKFHNELKPWQKILGYLSLAYYYGQTSMPCQFFVSLLAFQQNYDVTIADFPFPVGKFIVTTTNEKRNSVRICHYVIAKEILEQILTRKKQVSESPNKSRLSMPARNELYEFLMMFLEDIKARKIKNIVKSGIIADILRRTLIFRDNQDVGDNEIPGKSKLSRLLADIDCKAPYMERVNVLKRLTEIFPEDANFHAHLGRMYSICRPEDEEKAEQCFIHAVDLCKRKSRGKSNVDLDEGTKHTLKHVYHMFGMFYLQRITRYTGKSHGDKPEIETQTHEFERRVKQLLQYAKEACEYFSETRELTVLIGYEEAYGYVGEIATRLKICEFIHRHMPFKEFEEFLKASPELELTNFVKESITTILELFLQCYGSVDHDDLPKGFFKNIYWYNALFKNQAKELEKLDITEDIYSRRLHVAVIKLKYGKDESLGTLESITSKSDIEEIVRVCEQNFRDADQGGIPLLRSAIDLEHKDWMNAIRHEQFSDVYNTADVIRRVRHWHDILRSPNSTFYLFILLSILGFGYSESISPNVEMLREAQELQDKLKKLSKTLTKPRKPKEWCGKGPGIKCIIPARRVRNNGEDRMIAGDSSTTHLAVFKGTISRPHTQRQTGYIKMDLGDNVYPVRVFFVPVKTKDSLVGIRYAGERVEFVLAFTYADGYEAYNVALLKKYSCNNCNRRVEITSDVFKVLCKCGEYVTKMDC